MKIGDLVKMKGFAAYRDNPEFAVVVEVWKNHKNQTIMADVMFEDGQVQQFMMKSMEVINEAN